MNSPCVESSQRCVPPDWSISGRPVAMVSRSPANQKMRQPGGDICIVCSALIHRAQPGNDYMMATEQRHKE